jgi:hypothetical protein
MIEKRATPKLLFTDKAGNKLYGMAKKNGSYQWAAHNANGELVTVKGTLALIKAAGLGGTIGKKLSSKVVGNYTVAKYDFKGEVKCRK